MTPFQKVVGAKFNEQLELVVIVLHYDISNGKHCAYDQYKITKDSVTVLAREDVWLKRKVRQVIEIKIGQPAMNRDQGHELLSSPMNFCCHGIDYYPSFRHYNFFFNYVHTTFTSMCSYVFFL